LKCFLSVHAVNEQISKRIKGNKRFVFRIK
jgi:hypothetical protein